MKRLFQSISLLLILLISSAIFAQEAKTLNLGVLNEKLINPPTPVYPVAARAVKASGQVIVNVTIDETGGVTEAKAITGHPLLRKAAEDAAKQAEFKPTMLGGKAIAITGNIIFNFTSDGKASLEKTKGKSTNKNDAENNDAQKTNDATDTTLSSEKSNPPGEQKLEGRYKNSSAGMNYYTFHSDGTFIKASAGGTANSAYGTERPGTYYVQGNTITLKFTDGAVDKFPFEILDNKDLKINGVIFWVWNN